MMDVISVVFAIRKLKPMKKDIFKLDNYFIPWGSTILVITILSLVAGPPWFKDQFVVKYDNTVMFFPTDGGTLEQAKKEHPRETVTLQKKHIPPIRSIMLLSGIVILTTGIWYRRLENKIIRVWNVLENTKEVKVDQLTASLGMTRAFILENLARINLQNSAYYIFDPTTDKIVDGKLKVEFNLSQKCPGCGNSVNKKVTLDFSEKLTCEYCGTVITEEQLNQHKIDILKHSTIGGEKSGFSWGVFLPLFIFFWPAGIIYAIVKGKNASSSMEVNQDNIFHNIRKYADLAKEHGLISEPAKARMK